MFRRALLLALAACEPGAAIPVASAPPTVWLTAPPAGSFPLGAITGRLGRSQAPQAVLELGIAAPDRGVLAPLRQPTLWSIPGDGPARAIAYGSDGARPALELVEIDAGRVVWRDTEICAAPIVGVTAEAIVCADANGTRAIGLDGTKRWAVASAFIAFTEDRVAVSGAGASIILDAATGDEIARVKLPAGVTSDAVIASCGDAGRELFAVGRDGRLRRIAEAKGGPAVAWAVSAGAIAAIDACAGDAIVVTEITRTGRALFAVSRKSGAVTGRIDEVTGAWPARDGSDRLEVATAGGVASYPRDLAGPPVPLALPPLGELLASRGEQRLIRATPLTAVVVDRAGVRAFVPLAAMGAALGDRAIVAASWAGSPAEITHRFALPVRWGRRLRLPPRRGGTAVDAELRDLPPVVPADPARAIALADTGRLATPPVIDPLDGSALYAIAIGGSGDHGAVARADLLAQRWRWQRPDGCGEGQPVGLALARDVVVCAARRQLSGPGDPHGGPLATIRATSRDGRPRWDTALDEADGVIAGGDVVVVHAGARATVLDARDGGVRGHLASDDGGPVRAAVVTVDDATLVVTAERGRVVARLGLAGLLPVWSFAVAGVVRSLAPSGDGVLVALEDGDAYRIDARTAEVIALPGLGLDWRAAGDLVTGHTLGGPIPGPLTVAAPPPPPIPAPVRAKRARAAKPARPAPGPGAAAPAERSEVPPAPIATPIPASPALGDSWQLTLYELTGAMRARNDYALGAPIEPPARRGPAGSPLVVAYGLGTREVIVLDPRTGDPLRRVRLPDDAPRDTLFGTVVDGSPVAGVLLGGPLRVVLY